MNTIITSSTPLYSVKNPVMWGGEIVAETGDRIFINSITDGPHGVLVWGTNIDRKNIVPFQSINLEYVGHNILSEFKDISNE